MIYLFQLQNHQSRILMILKSLGIEFEAVDVSAPGKLIKQSFPSSETINLILTFEKHFFIILMMTLTLRSSTNIYLTQHKHKKIFRQKDLIQ